MRRAATYIAAAAIAVVLVAYLVGAADDPAPDGGRGQAAPSGPPPPPFSASVETSSAVVDGRERGVWRIGWQLGPSVMPDPTSTVAGYEVEVLVDGLPLSPAPLPVVEPVVEASRWPGFGSWDADVPFVLRVRAQFDDGTWSRSLSQALVLPAVVPVATDWLVGAPATLVSDPGTAHGLPMWVDGNIGFAPLDTGLRAFGANGPGTASWQVSPEAFVSGVNHTSLKIEGQDDPYAAGGPVYVHDGDEQDPSDDRLIAFYHGEDHSQSGADPTRFWSYLGMAVSDDEGGSFVDAGKIVAPDIPSTQPLGWGVEVGGGAYAIVEDGGVPYFYVYFRDTLAEGANVKLAVARAPVEAVVAAAEGCRPAAPDTCVAPPFAKYDGSNWSAEGVADDGTHGGAPADLFASVPRAPTPIWFDVVELSSRGIYVLLFSWVVPDEDPAGDGVDGWSYAVSSSTDGLEWSQPTRIIETDPTHELIYVTLAAADLSSPRSAATDELAIFRTRTEFGEPGPPSRWSGGVFLDRLALTYQP